MALFNAVITGESTLSLTRTEILRALGRKAFGGDYGEADVSTWSSADQTKANDAIASGLRMFYGAHDWTFLRPWFRATLEVDVASYDLPEDFGGAVDALIYTGDYACHKPIAWAPLIEVQMDLERNVGSSVPTKFAIETLPHSGESQGQRHAIHFNMRPSAAYTISGQYYVDPYTLSSSRPYPLGGAEYAECLKHAILAAWEGEMQDNPNGPSNVIFQRLLPRCIKTNQRQSPKLLGVNGKKRLVPADGGPPIFTGDIRYGGSSVFGG